MSKTALGIRTYLFLFSILALSSWTVWASDVGTHKKIGGMDVYIGIIPAEVIQGRDLSMEKKMHGGAEKGVKMHHLVLALFDTKSGKRISEAKITANIASTSSKGNTNTLERMKINKVVTFGNYFVLPRTGPYYVQLKLDVPGKKITDVVFEFSSPVK